MTLPQSEAVPLSYGVLLYPGFEVLDIAGPLECLNTITHRYKDANLSLAVIGRPIDDDPAHKDIPMDLTPSDPSVSGFSFQSQQVYKPTHTVHNAPPLDMILIPGGFGSLPPSKTGPEVAFLKARYPSLKHLLTICSGSGMAAAAGILDGKRATTNKAVWKEITSYGPKTYWVAQARWEVSGNIWTTSGVSAGTDGMVAFLASIYGDEVVENMCNGMEYNRVKSPHDDPFAKIWGAEDVPPKEE